MIVYLVLLILSSLSQNFIEEPIKKKKERNFPHVNNKTFLEGFKKKKTHKTNRSTKD